MAVLEDAYGRVVAVFQRVEEYLLEENRALSREKAIARFRVNLPEPQKKLEDIKPVKLSKVKVKELKKDLHELESEPVTADDETRYYARKD